MTAQHRNREALLFCRAVVWAFALAAAAGFLYALLPSGPQDTAGASPALVVRDAQRLPLGTATATPAGPGTTRIDVALSPFALGGGREAPVTVYRARAPWPPPSCATLAAGHAAAESLGVTTLGRLDALVRGSTPPTVLTVGAACLDVTLP